MEEYIIDYFSDSAFFFGAAISALTFIDGLFMIGLIINGWGAFFACLYAYSNNLLTLAELIIFSFVGVTAGELVSFLFGKKYKDSSYEMAKKMVRLTNSRKSESKRLSFMYPNWSLESLEKFRNKADSLILKYGGLSLIIGRWTPIASLVPVSCALSAFPLRKFLIFSPISCLLWAGLWNLIVLLVSNGIIAISG